MIRIFKILGGLKEIGLLMYSLLEKDFVLRSYGARFSCEKYGKKAQIFNLVWFNNLALEKWNPILLTKEGFWASLPFFLFCHASHCYNMFPAILLFFCFHLCPWNALPLPSSLLPFCGINGRQLPMWCGPPLSDLLRF